jgi:hypothetical protein
MSDIIIDLKNLLTELQDTNIISNQALIIQAAILEIENLRNALDKQNLPPANKLAKRIKEQGGRVKNDKRSK